MRKSRSQKCGLVLTCCKAEEQKQSFEKKRHFPDYARKEWSFDVFERIEPEQVVTSRTIYLKVLFKLKSKQRRLKLT